MTTFFGSRQKRKLFVTLSTFLYKPEVQAAMMKKYLLFKSTYYIDVVIQREYLNS